jgi:magnesium transporter
MERPAPSLPWIHLSDATDGALDILASQHGFHELDVEDCRHRRQVAKVAEHSRYTFVVIKTIEWDKENDEICFHDFDLFVMPDLLVTVAEGANTAVIKAQAALPQEPEFHYAQGIAYMVIDHAVDEYLPVLDALSDKIEDIEDEVLENATPAVLQKIFRLKSILIEFRRNTTAMREVLNHLMRSERAGQTAGLYPYYRDIYDHLVRALDFIESYRDMLASAMDIYLSAVANRTNDVMKILTIYGTISIPLLAITGFYGMNVKLPLQDNPRAVWYIGGMLLAGCLAMVLYFRTKKWV